MKVRKGRGTRAAGPRPDTLRALGLEFLILALWGRKASREP